VPGIEYNGKTYDLIKFDAAVFVLVSSGLANKVSYGIVDRIGHASRRAWDEIRTHGGVMSEASYREPERVYFISSQIGGHYFYLKQSIIDLVLIERKEAE